MKRISCFLLALTLLLSLAACASGTPSASTPAETAPAETPSDSTPAEDAAAQPEKEIITLPLAETLTFTFWTPMDEKYMPYKSMAEHPAYVELAKRTNVEPEFIHPPTSGAQDQYGLILASGEYYDVMYNTYSAFTDIELVENDIAIDLSELVPEYMPNYYGLITGNEMLQKDTTSQDGRILMLYSLKEQSALNWWGLGLRKDLLDKAGVALPETYEDWELCLKTFQEAGVERPLSMPRSGYFYNNAMEAGFGVGYGFYQDGDKVKYGPMEDGFLDYLTQMNDWFNKGYISASFVSDEERFAGIPTIADVAGGVVGASLITSSEIGDVYAEMSGDPDFYYAGVANPVKSDGSSKVWSTVGGSGLTDTPFIVTTAMDEERLPELLTYFDYLYAGEGADLVSWGVEGDAYYVDENGEKCYTDKVNNSEYDSVNTFHIYGMAMFQTLGLYNDKERVRMPHVDKEKFEEILAMKSLWAADGTGFGTLPNLTFTAEESEAYSGKQTDCMTHTAENIAKFIMGVRPLSEFDDFRSELQKLGIEDVLEIYQAAFDRYYQR